MEATGRQRAVPSGVPDGDAAPWRDELGAILSWLESAPSDAASPRDEFDAAHEQMILRFVAPVLGAAVDDRTLDRARVQVFLRETIGYATGVVAAAVSAVWPEVADLGLDALADRLAVELDRFEELDTESGPLAGSGGLLDADATGPLVEGGAPPDAAPAASPPHRPVRDPDGGGHPGLVPGDPAAPVPGDAWGRGRGDARGDPPGRAHADPRGLAPGDTWGLALVGVDEAEPPWGPEPAVRGGGEPVPERFGYVRATAEPLGPPSGRNDDEIEQTIRSPSGAPSRVLEPAPRPRGPPERVCCPHVELALDESGQVGDQVTSLGVHVAEVRRVATTLAPSRRRSSASSRCRRRAPGSARRDLAAVARAASPGAAG